MRAKVLATIAVVWSLFGTAIPAFAGPVFTDSTFNLANYTSGPVFLSDPSASISFIQCLTCGDPGSALQFTGTSTTTSATVAVALLNSNFVYDPLTQGAVTSISTSVDKNIIVSATGTNFTNTFHPTIEQDGIFYIASIVGALFTGPNTPGGTGYLEFSNNDLLAADFVSFDFSNDSMGTAHPNFGGDPMQFGITQITGLGTTNESVVTQYDNLNFSITSVPEPYTLSLFGAGLAGAAALRRRKKVKADRDDASAALDE